MNNKQYVINVLNDNKIKTIYKLLNYDFQINIYKNHIMIDIYKQHFFKNSINVYFNNEHIFVDVFNLNNEIFNKYKFIESQHINRFRSNISKHKLKNLIIDLISYKNN